MFVSMGNKTDVSGNDLLEYWEDNPDVQAILMYLESFGNPRRFTAIARRVTRKKPIVAVKAGRTAQGARGCSLAHRVDRRAATSPRTRFSSSAACCASRRWRRCSRWRRRSRNQPVPQGDRVAIVTNAGGPGILCTDALVGAGLTLAELSPATTRRRSRRRCRPRRPPANPGGHDRLCRRVAVPRRARARVARIPASTAIIAIFVSPIMIDAYEVAVAIAAAADGSESRCCRCSWESSAATKGSHWLRRSRVPVYRFPEDAAAAMAGLARYRVLRDRPVGKVVTFRAPIPAARDEGDRRRRGRRGARCCRRGRSRRCCWRTVSAGAVARVRVIAAEAVAAAQTSAIRSC